MLHFAGYSYRILIVLVILLTSQCNTKIIGAAILPHGDFAYDPDLLPHNQRARRLHAACQSIAHWIMDDMKPDLILLTTPHGLKLEHSYLIYENEIESGDAMIGADLHDPSFHSLRLHLNITSDNKLARKLVRLMNEYGNEVEGLSSFGNQQTLPLKWGEIIPIQYLEDIRRETAANGVDGNEVNDRDLPSFIILSFPKIRHRTFIEDLLYSGSSLWNILDDESITGERNIMILISADLAHTHYDERNMPYGYCECAQKYDDAISEWIELMDRDSLLQSARLMQLEGAKSCGFGGFVLLQGMFDSSVEVADADWTSILLVSEHPSYYGMAVANFTRS